MVGEHGKPTILVVEDDEAIRDSLQELLQEEGYCVDTAADGREALAVLETRPRRPCLILLDLFMTVMDGWQFLAVVENDARWAQIPITVVSAVSDIARRVGRRRFMKKPLDLDVLLQEIKRICCTGDLAPA